MIKGGYRGKILRVNLTTGIISKENIADESVLRKYIGCFGLGLWYLMKELPMGISPLDTENLLIFLTGPMTALRTPCPTNCTVTTLNADTGFTVGRAHSHGWFGSYLKKAGFDGIIITGASSKWVYLWIDDAKIELRSAEKLLGKDTHETEDMVKEELCVSTKAGGGVSVAAIGPAGENLVAGALIENDKNHSFAHAGAGTIMGSKKLKAIAVRGTGEVNLFDPETFGIVGKEWIRKTIDESSRGTWEKANAGPSGKYGGGIIKDDYKGVKALLGLSAKNFTANTLPHFGEGWSRQKLTPRPCYRCPLGCAVDVEMLEGAYKGQTFTLSGGGENIEGAASIVGAGATTDPGEALYLADLYDHLGMETATIGCSLSVAFEAYEKGLITEKDTDGLALKWGDANVVATLLKRIAHRQGKLANMLADGPKAAALRVGLPDASVDIKGTGMNLHDWRKAWGVLLGALVGGGTGWGGPGVDCWCTEPDVGYPEKTNPLDPFNKSEEVAKTTILKMWDDSIGNCWFATWGLPNQLKLATDAISAAVGWENFTPEEALIIGHRIVTLERIFNMAHGLTSDDDINISKRIAEPMPPDSGKEAGITIAPYIEGWIRDYYNFLGWDRKMGRPWMSTIKQLGLEEFQNLVWKT